MKRFVAACALAVLLAVPVIAFAADGPTPKQVRAELARLHLAPLAGDHALVISAGSMEPTLRCAKPGIACTSAIADRILVRVTVAATVPRGTIIVVATPPNAMGLCASGSVLVKRVVGLAGDRVEERKGRLFVNGKRVVEPYVSVANRDVRTIRPTRVPPRSLYVLGDNRVSSCDSRVWGAVPFEGVLGRAVAIYWPHARTRRL